VKRFFIRFSGLALIALFVSQLALASTLEQGIALYQRESNDEAERALKTAREEDPSSTRAAFYLGLTYKRLQRYKEAREQLLFAVQNEPKIKEALLELVEVLYQLNQNDEALRWIEVAEVQGIRPAQTVFLKGLVLMKKEKSSEAIDAFKKAKELDAALTQSADYQIGVAHMRQQEYGEAADAFRDVQVLDPNTDIGVYAQEYVKAIERRKDAGRPWKLNVGVFGEYDDNVVLRPGDATAVDTVGDEDDFREVVTVNGEYDHRFNERFGVKGSYDLYFANQEDLDAFDINSHTVGLTPTWYSKNWTLSVPVTYNYTWVDGDDFLGTVTAGPVVNARLGKNQLLQGSLRFQDKNFFRSPVIPAEDRDAFRWAPGGAWYWFFHESQGFFGARYEYDSENTEGQNWDYDGHRINLSLQWPFSEKLKGTLAGEYYWQDFDNVHSIFGSKRQDETLTFSALLTYSLTKQLDLQFRYTYVNHDSNLALYDYDRNVVSTGVIYRF
jgi:tetratricopeptide (TPR) repeat protein